MINTKNEKIRDFIKAFEEVFDKDWTYSKQMMGVIEETEEQRENGRKMGLETIEMISPDGTFLHPKVEDETEDWGNRAKLLEAYKELKDLI